MVLIREDNVKQCLNRHPFDAAPLWSLVVLALLHLAVISSVNQRETKGGRLSDWSLHASAVHVHFNTNLEAL